MKLLSPSSLPLRALLAPLALCAAPFAAPVSAVAAPPAAAPLAGNFAAPPKGYGQVPFWWWAGEKLSKERLLWQLEQLHAAGVSGTQINYPCERGPGWPTAPTDPALFSKGWWELFAFVATESAKRGMGIGLSGYTLDWPGRASLFQQIGVTTDAHNATRLVSRAADFTATTAATAVSASSATATPTTTAAFAVSAAVPASADSLAVADGSPLAARFAAPPKGYGQVPFWWWTGEKLSKERLLWQLDQLHAAGVSGAQINYSHERGPGWPTAPTDPALFSKEWWDIFAFVAAESAKRGMGIGLSGYTLDWPGRASLFRQIGVTTDAHNATRLVSSKSADREVGAAGITLPAAPAGVVSVTAFPLKNGRLDATGAVSLDPASRTASLPPGRWRVFTVSAECAPSTYDPLDPQSGARVVERFFKPFLDNTPAEARSALNYFFQDELRLAGAGPLWSPDFAAEFRRRKGYDVAPLLGALFADLGPRTAKIRLDYNDVFTALSEERYFRPVFDWHNSRGMIYACDPGSRGFDPLEFGSYFRAMRNYTAPGFDTPGSSSDVVKNKVGSSIAHLYERPRVWVEGFHSLGWQASTETIFDASNRNFLYGSTLLNLHGLYYTTYGGWWEWAPPCYHFRMPYWKHIPAFFRYFERLSYLLSQGHHVADVAIVYPQTPLVCNPAHGKRSVEIAFALCRELMQRNQTDNDFIDDDSLARASVNRARDGTAVLRVAGENYRVLVLPRLFATRFSTLQKALEFYRAGGKVVAIGELPAASDNAGANDPALDAAVKELFGLTAAEAATAAADKPAPRQTNAAGGVGVFLANTSTAAADVGEDARIKAALKLAATANPNALAPVRTYAGKFSGRWVWTREKTRRAVFKQRLGSSGTTPIEYDAALLADNSATLYLNGRVVARHGDYNTPWTGKLRLRSGDVLAIAASDSANERGDKSAGIFFALARNGKTIFSAEDFLCYPANNDVEMTAIATTSDFGGRLKKISKRPDTAGDKPDVFPSFATQDASAKPDTTNVHALHRFGKDAAAAKPAAGKPTAAAIRALLKTPDFSGPAGAQALHRRFEGHDIFFIMDLKPEAKKFTPDGEPAADCVFRVRGTPQRWDAWTGKGTPLSLDAFRANPDGTVTVRIATSGEPLLLVFDDANPASLGGARNFAEWSDSSASPRSEKPLALDGQWSFRLAPTLDNRWGDFRFPATKELIGAETRRFTWRAEGLRDTTNTYSHGPQFRAFGPLLPGRDADALEHALAAATRLGGDTVEVAGKPHRWATFNFSWREGAEGMPAYQNWHHGLSGKVGDDFFVLGNYERGSYDVSIPKNARPEVRLFQTTVVAPEVCEAEIVSSGVKPSAVWLNGKKRAVGEKVALRRGRNPLVVRYDSLGRAGVVLRRVGADAGKGGGGVGGAGGASAGVPLASRWFGDPAVLPFDIFDGAVSVADFRSFAPPALVSAEVTLRGELLAATVGGLPWKIEKTGRRGVSGVGEVWRISQKNGNANSAIGASAAGAGAGGAAGAGGLPDGTAEMVLRVRFESGYYGGAAFPEPVKLECAEGLVRLGDWGRLGDLQYYSGGAIYTKRFTLGVEQRRQRCVLDLGNVGVSCEVRLNGKSVGVRTCPPWRFDISAFVASGANVLEVEVCNTLNNHYQTIPTRYKRPVTRAPSGLLGPVKIDFLHRF
ncbi:MAG: hypothetical protein LBT53_00625 [Puniceicoccales bacterium]|jgi:hypothetical protein|nr:hypothetical protein [Puniceicoccales bacterium]